MACPRLDCIVGPAILIYLATAITELVSSVPVGLVQNDYAGHCILSGKVEYILFNDSLHVQQFGSNSACEFCTYLTIFTILFPLVYGGYSAYALYQTIDNASQMWVLPAMMSNVLLLVLKFISSCVLSIGVSQLCKSVKKSADSIKTCRDGQGKDWYAAEDIGAINGKNYDTYLTTAQSASWFCVFEWVLLSALSFLHYRRNMKLRSSGSSIQTGDGGATSDTAGVVANEFLPGTSIVNPNYNGAENDKSSSFPFGQ